MLQGPIGLVGTRGPRGLQVSASRICSVWSMTVQVGVSTTSFNQNNQNTEQQNNHFFNHVVNLANIIKTQNETETKKCAQISKHVKRKQMY